MLTFITRRYLGFTLFVALVSLSMVALGVWQLDRLRQKRESNAAYLERIAATTLDLNTAPTPLGDPADLEYLTATATGTFDYDREVLLRNQTLAGQNGVHLLTPLVFPGGDSAVLVNRGFIPRPPSFDDRAAWAQYRGPAGETTITGLLTLSFTLPDAAPPTGEELSLFRPDLPRLQQQLPYTLYPLILTLTDDDNPQFPTPQPPEIDLTEGSHLSYAIQWFSFAAIGLIGYLAFIRRRYQRRQP